MAKCPLCSERAGKRYCPAKLGSICAVCCGTKREVEIDCPTSCEYLRASWEYEADRRVPDPELAVRVRKFDERFVQHYAPLLELLSRSVAEERAVSPWLVDNDVIEVYKALTATMKTLSSGIYYESLPDSTVRVSLFRRLKAVIDKLMTPDTEAPAPILKVSEILDILEFLTLAGLMNSNMRPKSRRYLQWLSQMSGAPDVERPSGLILP